MARSKSYIRRVLRFCVLAICAQTPPKSYTKASVALEITKRASLDTILFSGSKLMICRMRLMGSCMNFPRVKNGHMLRNERAIPCLPLLTSLLLLLLFINDFFALGSPVVAHSPLVIDVTELLGLSFLLVF